MSATRQSPSPWPRRFAAAAACVALVAFASTTFVVLGRWPERAGPAPPYVPAAVPEPFRDLAVSCLVLGTSDPSLDELPDADVEALVDVVARLAHAYERASFDSFLALHAADLAHAEHAKADHIETLRSLAVEAGAPPDTVAAGWHGALEAFRRAYYVRPPIARLIPEATRLELNAIGRGAYDPGAWRDSFATFVAVGDRPVTEHRLAVPHRRTLDALLEEGARLRWFDLHLRFESSTGNSGSLVARFVCDEGEGEVRGEWFLERATTIHEGDTDSRCLRLVL